MKNLQIIISITVFIFLSCQINAQLQVRNDAFIQIGYEDYRTLSFGEESNLPNNGKFAIEHVNTKFGVGGLNFWKPWPTPNYGNYMLWLRDDKNVAIGGYGSSFYKLMVYGSAYSLGSWVGSDRKLKSNIQPLYSGIEQILKLKPKSYIYDFNLEKYSTSTQDVENDEIKKNTIEGDQFITYKSGRMLGFIADELGQVFPQLVQKDEEGFEAINYDGLIPVLVSAIQEQHERIVALENALNSKKEPTIKNKPSNKIENTNQQFSRLLYNSPNPFNNLTKISYYLSKKDTISKVSILMYNNLGNIIREIPIERNVGEGKVQIDLNSQASGMYYYSLLVDGKNVDSKAMILSR